MNKHIFAFITIFALSAFRLVAAPVEPLPEGTKPARKIVKRVVKKPSAASSSTQTVAPVSAQPASKPAVSPSSAASSPAPKAVKPAVSTQVTEEVVSKPAQRPNIPNYGVPAYEQIQNAPKAQPQEEENNELSDDDIDWGSVFGETQTEDEAVSSSFGVSSFSDALKKDQRSYNRARPIRKAKEAAEEFNKSLSEFALNRKIELDNGMRGLSDGAKSEEAQANTSITEPESDASQGSAIKDTGFTLSQILKQKQDEAEQAELERLAWEAEQARLRAYEVEQEELKAQEQTELAKRVSFFN